LWQLCVLIASVYGDLGPQKAADLRRHNSESPTNIHPRDEPNGRFCHHEVEEFLNKARASVSNAGDNPK
jgi:hypothetical protein